MIKIISWNSIIVILLFASLEIGSRHYMSIGLPDPLISKYKSGWFDARQYDPKLFWVMTPNIEFRYNERLNSLGLRNREILDKSADSYRILSLGESSTFGTLVSSKETYSYLLEKEIGVINDKNLEVINAGVPGYSSFQGLTFLQKHGLALKPDAVMLYFGFNDFLRVAFRSNRDAGNTKATSGLTDRELFNKRSGLSYKFFDFMLNKSNLFRLILVRNSNEFKEKSISKSKKKRVPELDRRWVLNQFYELSRQYNFRLIVIVPWYSDFEKHAPLLRELDAWENVTLIDLPEKLKGLPKPIKDYFKDRVHPNAIGHQLIANEISKELLMKK